MTKSHAERQDPTAIGRHDLTPITSVRAGRVLEEEGNGDDDWLLMRFPASELPEPPYNVIEGSWTKWGRSDRPYPGALLLAETRNPGRIEPSIVMTDRAVNSDDRPATGHGLGRG